MAFMEWHDDLAVGVPKLDQEHRQLIALVGDLFNTADSPRDVALFEWRMDLLIKHTLAHFTFEERDARDELPEQANTPASASGADRANPSIANSGRGRCARLERGHGPFDPRLAARVYNRS
jgi:hemerythrin